MTIDSIPSLRDAFKELFSIVSKWKTIGILLGLNEDLLQTIMSENTTEDNRLSGMLIKWRRQLNPRPTWKRLIDAVNEVNPAKAEEIRMNIATQ